MSDALMQRHEAVIQSRLATVTTKLDKAIAEGKTSFVFHLPDGIVIRTPFKLFESKTWRAIELAGWGPQLEKILARYGLEVAYEMSSDGDGLVQGYIKGTKPRRYGIETTDFWLDRPDNN